jgi:hypothetical protein
VALFFRAYCDDTDKYCTNLKQSSHPRRPLYDTPRQKQRRPPRQTPYLAFPMPHPISQFTGAFDAAIVPALALPLQHQIDGMFSALCGAKNSRRNVRISPHATVFYLNDPQLKP